MRTVEGFTDEDHKTKVIISDSRPEIKDVMLQDDCLDL